jgi:hypothetical protein
MIGFNVPRSYYRETLPASMATDYIEFEVQPPMGSAHGHATLRLSPFSPGKTQGKAGGGMAVAGLASLSEIEISVTAPRCILGAPTASPYPIDLTMTKPGEWSRCAWRHGACRLGERITYEVAFRTHETRPLRFEFQVRAAELKRPIALTCDAQAQSLVLAAAVTSPVGSGKKQASASAGRRKLA